MNFQDRNRLTDLEQQQQKMTIHKDETWMQG